MPKFFGGFSWAVPNAFADALGLCRFEQGDTLYDTRNAYQPTWGESLKHISWGIEILSPKRSEIRIAGGAKVERNDEDTETKSRDIFNNNWKSQCELRLIDYKNGSKRTITTTQGQLYSFLHKGDFNILEQLPLDHEAPLLVRHASNLLSFAENYAQEHLSINKNTNFFILPFDVTNDTSVKKSLLIQKNLQIGEYDHQFTDCSLKECGIPDYEKYAPTVCFRCFQIPTRKIEKLRDCLKQSFWIVKHSSSAKKTIKDVFKQTKALPRFFEILKSHGIFVPYQVKSKGGDQKIYGFDHKPIYRYRLVSSRAELFPNGLERYLNALFENCPNHLYSKKTFRGSKEEMMIDVDIKHTDSHPLITLTKASRDFTEFKSRHENVGKYLLDNDPKSVAVEVPIWVECGEFKDYEDVFGSRLTMTGHIDLLRLDEDGKIAVWDYKPNAYKEKKAHVQTFLYAFMLSVRSGIPLSRFRCGYFDEIDVFTFNPVDVQIQKQLTLEL